MTTDDLAGLLAEHAGARHVTVGDKTYIECDALGCDARWTPVEYRSEAHAAHQAAVVRAAGWRRCQQSDGSGHA